MLNMKYTLILIYIYVLTFAIVLPLICCLLPLRQSVYYQLLTRVNVLLKPDMAYQMDNDLLTELFTKNAERLDVANRFLQLQQPFVTKNVTGLPLKYLVQSHSEVDAHLAQQVRVWTEHVNTNSAVSVTVLVISAGRDSVVSSDQQFAPGYLTQIVARFIALFSQQQHSDRVSYRLLVCSVGEHITTEEHTVGRLVPLVRDAQLDSGLTFGPFHDRLAWRYEKEKRDYAFCLRQAARNVKFVLTVEDDALPMNESLSVLSRLVTGHWTSRPDGNIDRQWFYVKFYHPSHLQSYISLERERLPQLFAAGIVLGSCLYLVISWCIAVKTSDRNLAVQHVPWFHCCMYCGLMVLCIGRVHVDCWRRLFAPYVHYLVPDKFCCTQAILYAAEYAHDVAAYLDRTSCNETFHKDDALWKFVTSGYLIQPNVFEHVGVWSAVRHGFVDPHTIDT